MHALPFALAGVLAVALSPAIVGALGRGGWTRPNHRGRTVAFPLGVLIVGVALVALVPVMLIQRLGGSALLYADAPPIVAYVLGVAFLGLVDDGIGSGAAEPRGLRGHVRAGLSGRVTGGMLKAGGTIGLALFVAALLEPVGNGRWLLAAAVLVLATHVFNLLDLRPGRAIKALVLLGAGLTAGARDVRPLWALGLFAGPALVAGVYDLRERAMLGDAGAGLLGGLAGIWIVLALSRTGQIVALVLLAALVVYGEARSLSALIERTPGLRELDSWGRPS